MKNADKSAFPHPSNQDTHTGLTKREYFAAMAMQSFIQLMGNNPVATNKVARESDEPQSAIMVKASIEIADELLKQLES